MRIAHVVSSFEVGGAEWVALRLAAAQTRLGHRVTVLGLRDGPLRERCEELGVPARAFAGKSLRLASAVSAAFARGRFQIVNSHNPSAHRYALLAKPFGWPPLVTTLHGETAQRYAPGLFAPVATDAVVAVSSRVRETFLAKHPGRHADRLVVIDNGVPEPPVASPRPLHALRRPGHLVLFTALRLDPVKDLSTMLRAFAILRACHAAQLVIAGDGPERGGLEALARELRIERDVTFLGFRSDVAQLYGAADVFVLSSLTEGMSLSMLEAMASGLPVVATAVGGNPEVVVEGETGLLVPPADPGALAAALGRLCEDRETLRRFGAAGRRRVQERFSLEASVGRYDALYAALVAVGPLARLRGALRRADAGGARPLV